MLGDIGIKNTWRLSVPPRPLFGPASARKPSPGPHGLVAFRFKFPPPPAFVRAETDTDYDDDSLLFADTDYHEDSLFFVASADLGFGFVYVIVFAVFVSPSS